MKLNTSTGILGELTKPNSKKTMLGLALLITTMLAAAFAFTTVTRAIDVTMHVVRPADVRPISEVATGPAGWYEEAVGNANAEPTSTRAYNTAGSAEFTVGDSASYVELGLYKHTFASNRLADLPSLSYATWQQVDNTKAVSFQIGLDTDVTDTDTSWQGRMVFEPYLGNTDFYGNLITDGIWQTWLVNKPAANWWLTWSPSLTTKYGTNPCPQADPCTYSELLGLYPDAGFNTGFGTPLILKAGSGWASFNGFADAPAVGTSQVQEYWDFEPAAVTPTYPTTKEQCKNYGWQDFGSLFKNQGACVSYVAREQ